MNVLVKRRTIQNNDADAEHQSDRSSRNGTEDKADVAEVFAYKTKERLYDRVPVHKERHKVSASPQGECKAVLQGDILHSRRLLYQRSNV